MKKTATSIKRTAAALLVFILVLSLASPLSASGAEKKTIRVGWHDEPFFIKDENGRRTGYSYEYLCKVASYTGWDYEYVEGTFPELLQMLKDGEIDVLANVSYLEERAKSILYTSIPMGTDSYYVFVSPENTEISAEDFTSLDGKRVGVTKDTYQKDLFLRTEKMYGIETNLIENTCSEEESLHLLDTQFDAFVTLDVYSDPKVCVPICKIGSSDYYFAVSRERPDLLIELDAALNRIQDENKQYNQQLNDKYLKSGNTALYLTKSEEEWLSAHGKIKVGYQDNYLAFCASDPETGELTGALKDCLDYFSGSLANGSVEFEAVAFPTAASAIEAMMNGEIDCMFPANLKEYDSEQMGIVMTPALMRTEMDAVVLSSQKKEFVIKEDVTVAVNRGNTNYELFLAEHYPTWKRAYFDDTPTGLEAVAAGEADCVIISNYRYSNISKLCEKLHLSTVYTGVDMDYYFAVPKGETTLYSILSRVICAIPASVVHTALTYHSTEDVKMSFSDALIENLPIITVFITVILLIIIALAFRNIQAKKKVIEEEHLVNDLNRRVFVDALTSVRNKGAFNNYIEELQNKLENGESAEFAIGVFDCDNLKHINDQHGHDKGDLYIQTASRLICSVFRHSPVFRIGGDEFAVILQNDDFKNRDDLIEEFSVRQKNICSEATCKWEEVSVALGIAVYDPNIDSSVNDTARRADKIMYENKRLGKGKNE